MNANEIRIIIGVVIALACVVAVSNDKIADYQALATVIVSIGIISFMNAVNNPVENDKRVTMLSILLVAFGVFYLFDTNSKYERMYEAVETCYMDSRNSSILIERCQNYEYILGTTYMYNIIENKRNSK